VSVIEIDCSTGEAIERPLTPAEQAALDQAHAEAAGQMKADQWAEVLRIRGAELSQTDWLIEPWPADLSDRIAGEIHDNEQGWADFRQGLRDLPQTFGYPDGEPTDIVWPMLPPAPNVVGTHPPPYVQFTPPPNFHALVP